MITMVGWSQSSVLGSQVSGVEVLDSEVTVFVFLGGVGYDGYFACIERFRNK